MNADIFLRLSQHRIFWRLRAFAQRQRFSLLSKVFRLRYFAGDARTNAGVLLSFFTLTAGQFLLAICIAGALQIVELMLVPSLINIWSIPDSSTYVSWLSTLAQIGGVFIALYFAAVTAAAGAIYATVPNNIRELLARERVGNIYIQYLTLATFLPLCLIALNLFGLEPIRVALPVMVVMAGIGIVAFATLGRRAFNLFDPTQLAGSLFGDLWHWLDQVSVGGFRWRDPSFQKHAHRQSNSILETLQTLSDLAATHENLDSGPLLEFSIRISSLLSAYQDRKLRIPSESLWFEQKYEHKTWYLTEDTTTRLAHSTGTSLSPASVPKYDWLEDRLEAILIKSFELNIGRKRLDNVRDLLSGVDSYINALATNGNLNRATALVKKMCDLWEAVSSGPLSETGESAEEAGIVDALCFLHLRILVAYRTALDQIAPERTLERLRRIGWRTDASFYSVGFLASEIRQLEWLFPRMQMEVDVEGTIKTPTWYAQDLILKLQMEALIENVDSLIEKGRAFQDWSDRLHKVGRIWQSAAVLSRYLEYQKKLAAHFSFFLGCFQSLAAVKHLTDLQWPEFDKQRWINRTRELRTALGNSLAQHVVLLAGSKKVPDSIPDYLGQFMDETGENLLNALLDKRVQDAPSLFAPYLIGTFALFERMKPTKLKPDVWTEQKLQIAAAPVMDIFELSGYAKLLAELYGEDQLWTEIAKVWDTLLDINPATLPWLAALAVGGLPRFQIPHRGLVRTNWSMRVQNELNKVPKKNTYRGGSMGGFHTSDNVVHTSPLVRHYAKYSFLNGWEIFVSLYLAKRAGAEKLQWGRTVSDLNDSLLREEETYDENEDEESEEL